MTSQNEYPASDADYPTSENMDLPTLLDGVSEFMARAGQLKTPPLVEQDRDFHTGSPGHPSPNIESTVSLRRELLREEYGEYCKAEDARDLVETVDGLLDIIVIAYGTLLAYLGEHRTRACAAEVTRSNLDKVKGDGLPKFRADGKVIKPDNWVGPRIAETLDAMQHICTGGYEL